MRIAVALALALLAIPAFAASPKVEEAIKTIRAAAADPNLQKTFCALLEMKEKLGDKKDPKIEAAIDEYVKRLGPNFESAWDFVEDIDEHSPDGQAIEAVLDELEEKCPRPL
jgi:hypothetical protein